MARGGTGAKLRLPCARLRACLATLLLLAMLVSVCVLVARGAGRRVWVCAPTDGLIVDGRALY